MKIDTINTSEISKCLQKYSYYMMVPYYTLHACIIYAYTMI